MLVPVLLSGGSGTRLWPVSRKSFPKQFVNLVDRERSLLQATATRLDGLGLEKAGWIVVCNNDHRFLVADQLSQTGTDVARIILEPVARNTAPAIALAAIEALTLSPDAKLLVQTADHMIPDTDYFCELIRSAVAADQPMVTFGVRPTRPETGYGYIEVESVIEGTPASRVRRFVEKPDLEMALKYLESGQFLWNSGMFLLDARIYLDELDRLQPIMFKACRAAMDQAVQDLDFLRVDQPAFSDCPSVSVDYAVMEQSDRVSVMPFDSSWSDLGAWDAILDQQSADADGNVIVGDGLAIDTKNTLIWSERRMVAALGVEDLLITETPDAVLVASKDAAQDVKVIVDELRSQGRLEADEHVTGFRPWGIYESISRGDRFQVKRIVVHPGKSLSLQMHHYRAEHWIVVEGKAEVVNADRTFILLENESTFIPAGTRHRLTNPGQTDLVLIEVQSGSYLGEDDIIRFEDQYGRETR